MRCQIILTFCAVTWFWCWVVRVSVYYHVSIAQNVDTTTSYLSWILYNSTPIIVIRWGSLLWTAFDYNKRGDNDSSDKVGIVQAVRWLVEIMTLLVSMPDIDLLPRILTATISAATCYEYITMCSSSTTASTTTNTTSRVRFWLLMIQMSGLSYLNSVEYCHSVNNTNNVDVQILIELLTTALWFNVVFSSSKNDTTSTRRSLCLFVYLYCSYICSETWTTHLCLGLLCNGVCYIVLHT